MTDKSHDKHWQRSIKMSFEKEPQRRQIQKVKKQLKRNRQAKPARRKDWQPDDFTDTDELDFEPAERVMPRGERERRRTLSLLAAVQPGLQLRTGVVSEHSGKGRHITTQVTMLPLDSGGFVVDTPGIREFGLSGLPQSELLRFYPDLAAFAPDCCFADCTHRHEPACAVKAAVAAGTLAAMRHHNYQKIYETLT